MNEDQIERVAQQNKRSTRPWSNETTATCLAMRGVFGTTAYNYSKKTLNWPILSERSLQRKTEHITFAPGIQEFFIEVLGKKLRTTANSDADPKGIGIYAGLSFDAMSIWYGISFSFKRIVS